MGSSELGNTPPGSHRCPSPLPLAHGEGVGPTRMGVLNTRAAHGMEAAL